MIQNRLESLIKELKLPGILVSNPADLFYLTGVNFDGYFLFVSKAGVYAFTNDMTKSQVTMFLPDAIVCSSGKPLLAFTKFLAKQKIKKIELELGGIKLSTFKTLKSNHLDLLDSQNKIQKQRQIKDKKEIEYTIQSCKIAIETYNEVKKYIRPGVSETQIAFKIEELFAKRHVKRAFPTIVAFGANSAYPHHVSSVKKLAKNDTVLIDMGCEYNGYCSDLTRTFFLGKITDSQKRIYSIVDKAQKGAVCKLKPGVLANEVDAAARRVIESAGYGQDFIHSTGHGTGLEIHESPRLSKKDNTVIKPGMILTVEPGIYLSGEFGVRIEDTLLVTNKGSDILTK